MWKDLREHKPNIWQQSILQTTGPLRFFGMRKHQGRPLHFQRFPSPPKEKMKEKMNWKKMFLLPHKVLLPSHSQVHTPDLEESLLQETHFLSRLSALTSRGQKWKLDEEPSILTHIPSLKSTYLLSWSYSHLTWSFHHLTLFQSPWNLSLGFFFQGFWTSNGTATLQGPRMAASCSQWQIHHVFQQVGWDGKIKRFTAL